LKRLGILLLLGFITMMVIGCSEDTGGNQGKASNNNDDLESFKVGYMPNFASTYGVISSIENGNFEDKGLDVELVEFEDGPTIISALESGSIQAGYIGPGAHVLPVQGEAKIFTFSHLGNADEVIGNAEKGVVSIEDLKGKKIGVSTGTSSETILNLALKEAGLSKDDVTLTDMDASALVTAMNSGGVDAVAAWSPNTNTIRAELGDDAVTLAQNEDYAEEFPSIASWVVSPSYADENADTIEKFTTGLYEGMDYQEDNTDEVVKLVAKQTAIDDAAVEEQTEDAEWQTSQDILDKLEDGTLEGYYKQQQENFIEDGQLEEEDKVDVSEYLMLDNMKNAAENANE